MKEYTAKEEGYVFMYVSNESATLVDVYFDDVVMTHTKSNVIQYNEYYPFGMQTAQSWTRENVTGNNFLNNGGTELNTTTSVYDLPFRNYDPTLGRMNQVDPMATKYASLTPYNYSFNNPVMCNDVSGADPNDETLSAWRRLGQRIERAKTMDANRREAAGWRANVRAMYGIVGDDDLFPKFGANSRGSLNDNINQRQFNNGLISLANTFGLSFIGEASGGVLIPKWSIKYKKYTDGVTQFISATLIGFETLDQQMTQRDPADPSNSPLYLYFNGDLLHIVKNGVSVFSVSGVSGKPGKDGSFDYSVGNQKNKSRGPIPEGTYSVTPSEIQHIGFDDHVIGNIVNPITGIFGRKTGGWPGGMLSWGSSRLWIEGSAYGRDGFSIHGGLYPGSAGCIDLTKNLDSFIWNLKSYNVQGSIPLIVAY
jgi:RHS repeat-associated protein